MNIAAIICEYNPFHNGHQFQINAIKELLHPDYVIAIMSGDYTQRGEPAIYDKYTRSTLALQCGIDAVFEIPTCYACASAEFFATAGVTLCNHLSVVTSLVFGTEACDLTILEKIASILVEEPTLYQSALKEQLSQGMSFPIARKNALLTYFSMTEPSISLELISSTLDTPNNILGIEYLKALQRTNSTIKPYSIQRKGNQYHDNTLNSATIYSSATAIRNAMIDHTTYNLSTAMPHSCVSFLKENQLLEYGMQYEHFQTFFHYRFTDTTLCLTSYLDFTQELANRMTKQYAFDCSITDFLTRLHCRNYTNTRISRCLLHVLLGITTSISGTDSQQITVPYAKLLGFKQTSSSLIAEIKENATIPMIQKATLCSATLSDAATSMFLLDCNAHKLYQQVYYETFKKIPYWTKDHALILF